ncbi:Error-prone DNA polymerase [Methylibium sp. T29-B]|nr:Error-prone DNA polymerase [Methylibium sp. T29-B]
MPDCLALLIPRRDEPHATLLAQARWLAGRCGERASIAVELLRWADDESFVERLLDASAASGLPLAAAGDVLMHVRSRKPLQDTLTAIRLKRRVADCGYALMRNAEQHLRSRLALAQLCRPEWLQRSVDLARACDFSLEQLKYEYPDEIVPVGETASSHLRRLTEEGACVRYPGGVPGTVQAQIEREFALIFRKRYEAFFLTVHDVVRFARSKGILCQGRGSAANSAVCYCLGITEVDPTQTPLLFERFISEERGEAPTSMSTSNTSGARKSSSTSTASTARTAPRWQRRSRPTACAARCARSARRWGWTGSASTASRRATSGSTGVRRCPPGWSRPASIRTPRSPGSGWR